MQACWDRSQRHYFDDSTIRNRQAKHLEQLLNLAPNINFSSGASRGRFIQIRGIGERSQFIEPLNPSVGILVDGIDFTGIAGAATTMDIKQVEILRGPQGTLYGANALAGLINLTSNQPTGTTQGNLSLAAGSHNTKTVSGARGVVFKWWSELPCCSAKSYQWRIYNQWFSEKGWHRQHWWAEFTGNHWLAGKWWSKS